MRFALVASGSATVRERYGFEYIFKMRAGQWFFICVKICGTVRNLLSLLALFLTPTLCLTYVILVTKLVKKLVNVAVQLWKKLANTEWLAANAKLAVTATLKKRNQAVDAADVAGKNFALNN